jgi:antitoxin VapB
VALTRIFQSGNSQAVRLPKEFRFDVDEVEILRRGDEVILRPVAVGGGAVFDALAALPGDVWPEVRVDEPPQDREFD